MSDEELAALIEEQSSLIMSIDAQMARNSLEHADDRDVSMTFAEWSVRASSRRQYASARLVELLRARAKLAADEASIRRRMERAEIDLSAARERIAELGAEINRINTANAAKLATAREGMWRVTLDAERALLHHDRRDSFLRQARGSVPPQFRDAYAATCSRDGYPPPRTSAECAAACEVRL